MPNFAIHPPLHIRGTPDRLIRSIGEATSFVKNFQTSSIDASSPALLGRLASVGNPKQAEAVSHAFKIWLKERSLLLVPPDTR